MKLLIGRGHGLFSRRGYRTNCGQLLSLLQKYMVNNLNSTKQKFGHFTNDNKEYRNLCELFSYATELQIRDCHMV